MKRRVQVDFGRWSVRLGGGYWVTEISRDGMITAGPRAERLVFTRREVAVAVVGLAKAWDWSDVKLVRVRYYFRSKKRKK